MGFSTFVCDDCGDSYSSNYIEILPHRHDTTVIAPTCTNTGHTTYICADCGETVIADYTDMLPHDFIIEVTEPTCEEMGYTTYTCPDCQVTAETFYVEPLGHTKSDWIVDVPSTIEEKGSKHFECIVCGDILKTALIAMLPSYSLTDEDGSGNVGNYIVIVTDESGAVIENAEIWIDVDDNVKVKLPTEKLLDFEDKTTVTVLYAENENILFDVLRVNLARTPVEGVNVLVTDKNDNNAMGVTDENGKITLPDSTTDTGENGNGTIGGGDCDCGNENCTNDENCTCGEDCTCNENGKFTYVVTVTDKSGKVVKNCNISLGESNDIVVKLPTGRLMNRDNPITVTVTDQTGIPQNAIDIIVIGDADYIEKGSTDINGKLTVPPQDKGYTGEDGKIKVNGYIVKVEDTTTPIKNAFVTISTDNKITVLLPDTSVLDSNNQITVTVLNDKGEAVKALSVTVNDKNNATATKTTDTSGKIVVPNKPSGGGTGGGSGGGSGGSSGGSSGGGGYITPVQTTTHTAYVLGYPNGEFKPENNMTRAEAATIFARLLAEKNGDTIRTRYSFPDISETEWYAGYVAYLKNYGIIMGYPNGTFGADNTITRAEFTAMSVRFYEVYTGKTITTKNGKLLKDVQDSYWAADFIKAATANGWIVGYPDGTFRGEADITRAEVVTVVNRVMGRKADTSYIDKNISSLTRFNDVSSKHWAYYDIMEAANTHSIQKNSNPEKWVNQ